ncbi:MAG: Acetyltransferase domain [Planctomycetota bacterium]|jgi:GNAT superfamily N-acetyltransferase
MREPQAVEPKPAPADLQLRAFRVADAPAVEAWFVAPDLAVPPGPAGARWPERLVTDHRIVAKVAEIGGKQVGFLRMDCGPDRVADLTLVVAPEWRRKGLGRTLFDAALAHARTIGLRQLVASVDRGNVVALDFFADRGFQVESGAGGRILMTRLVHGGGANEPLDIDE